MSCEKVQAQVGGDDVLDCAAAVAALFAELIEGNVEFIFGKFVALRRVRQSR